MDEPIKSNQRFMIALLSFVLLTLPFALVLGVETESANLIPCGTKATGSKPCGYADFIKLIENIFNYLTALAVPIAAGIIAVGGLIMLTAGSNEGKRSQAKSIIYWAIWGLIIVLASYILVKAVFDFLVEPPYVPASFK